MCIRDRYWILAILTLLVTLACNFFGKGLIKVSGMLIGILVGYAAALAMGNVVSFAELQSASWFSLPFPFYFGLEFHADAIVMMILMYICLLYTSPGIYYPGIRFGIYGGRCSGRSESGRLCGCGEWKCISDARKGRGLGQPGAQRHPGICVAVIRASSRSVPTGRQ